MYRGDDPPIRVAQWCRHGTQPIDQLIDDPRSTISPHSIESESERDGIGHRSLRLTDERNREIAVDGRLARFGEQNETGRDQVRLHPFAGPITDLNFALRAYLVEIQHLTAVEHREPGGFPNRVDEFDQVGSGVLS